MQQICMQGVQVVEKVTTMIIKKQQSCSKLGQIDDISHTLLQLTLNYVGSTWEHHECVIFF